MKLYFLRHGIAADREEWHGSDSDRPLTGEGCDRIAREAKVFAKLEILPDLILTSPLVRAKQTAQIVAERLGVQDRLTEDPDLDTDFDAQRLGRIVQRHSGVSALMLVGHEPSMSETIGRIVGGASIDLKKGGLALVDVPDVREVAGTLTWLISPKVLLRS